MMSTYLQEEEAPMTLKRAAALSALDAIDFAVRVAIIGVCFYVLVTGLGEVFITHAQEICSLVRQ